MFPERKRALVTALCLGTLYLVWGSTYLAQRIAVSSLPPLEMATLRFAAAGAVLYAALRARGVPAPTRRAWTDAALSALPLMVVGMGSAAIGLSRVASGLAALVFGSVPLWTALFDRAFGGKLARLEAVGLAVGFGGVATVSLGGGLRADPVGAAILVGAAASYALGCVLTRRLSLAKGVMGTASQMLAAAPMLLAFSVARGERLVVPSTRAALALAYLVALGSLVAYSAFGWLLRNARPALATSHAFVNPIVALALGAALAGEPIGSADLVGLALVLCAVALVAIGARRAAHVGKPPRAAPAGQGITRASASGSVDAPCGVCFGAIRNVPNR